MNEPIDWLIIWFLCSLAHSIDRLTEPSINRWMGGWIIALLRRLKKKSTSPNDEKRASSPKEKVVTLRKK